MKRVVRSTLFFREFKFFEFEAFFAEHHSDSFRTSSLLADSSPPVISPTTVVLSVNLMMVLVLSIMGADFRRNWVVD